MTRAGIRRFEQGAAAGISSEAGQFRTIAMGKPPVTKLKDFFREKNRIEKAAVLKHHGQTTCEPAGGRLLVSTDSSFSQPAGLRKLQKPNSHMARVAWRNSYDD